MMKIITSLAAALSLVFMSGAAQAAPAHHHKHAKHAAASTGVTWKNWGGAPYASSMSDAMSDAKLGTALDYMVSTGKMPVEVANVFRANHFKVIRDNPEGITTPIPGQHVYLTPSLELDLMMSGGEHPHPMLDVAVGKTVIGKGKVAAAEALVWSVSWMGTLYNVYLPLTCFNWALDTQVLAAAPPPPAVQQPDCYTVMTKVYGRNGDLAEHLGRYGPDVLSACWAYRVVGQTEWIPLAKCADLTACYYGAVTDEVGGMRLNFRGLIKVPASCRDGCQIEFRVPRAFALSNVNQLVFCLERTHDRGSCGVQVRHDDYHATVATIFYDWATIPTDWKWRKLYWRFEALAKNCHLYAEK